MEPFDEQPEQPVHEGEQESPEASTDHPETGVPAVDEVLASLTGLESRPVSEHVTVFERAHQQLRRVLDGSPEGAAGAGHGG